MLQLLSGFEPLQLTSTKRRHCETKNYRPIDLSKGAWNTTNTINQREMLNVLTYCRVDHRYTTLIKDIYEKTTARVKIHENT